MSERQFTFNEKLASCILCTALLAQKTCEELSIYLEGSLTTPSAERLRACERVSPSTSVNNVALDSSFHKQTPSVMPVP